MQTYGDKLKRFNRVLQDIKSVKIQGATNIAKSALGAYFLFPTEKSRKKLSSLRVTEPLLFNVLEKAKNHSKEKILQHLSSTQERINKKIFPLIKKGDKIFTHCHSTTVTNALVYAKKKGKIFQVVNTETRPLYQGRKTSREISRAGIKVTTYVDSGMHQAIAESDVIFLGADAILKKGVINKVGSALAAEISHVHKKRFYIVADSWKFYPRSIRIEERDFREVWSSAPRKVKVRNPAFELIPKKYITKIISELGILGYGDFLRKVGR